MYGAPRMFCAKVKRKLSIASKPIRFLKNWQKFQKNMSYNMKMCVSSVSLFKICALIFYNLRKMARCAPYCRQRFHLFTQYVLCRYGRHRFSERCFCTKMCDFQQYHVRTSLKRMYGAPRMFCAKVERKLSIPSKTYHISKKPACFSKKYVMRHEI